MHISTLLAELRDREEVREYICDLLQDSQRMHRLSVKMQWQLGHDTLQPIDFLRLALDENGRPLLTDWQICFIARHVSHTDAFLQALRIVADERDTQWVPQEQGRAAMAGAQ